MIDEFPSQLFESTARYRLIAVIISLKSEPYRNRPTELLAPGICSQPIDGPRTTIVYASLHHIVTVCTGGGLVVCSF